MSKLSITESVKIIPVSESTLRRDLKKGNLSFETDEKGRKQIDISELERFYGQLKENTNGSQPSAENSTEQAGHAEPVNDTGQTPSMNGNNSPQNLSNDSDQNSLMNGSEPRQNPSLTENDSQKVIELLEGQVEDLKERLAQADSEKTQLLELANNLQKQNELLMLPSPKKKPSIWGYLRLKR